MNSESEDDEISLSSDLEILESKPRSINLLPERSRKAYEAVYNVFMEWRSLKNIDSFSENVLLAYFEEISKKYKSSSLWAHYSMLRSTLIINNDVNIEKYFQLRAFLKRKSKGYRPKKAKIFTPAEVNKFIMEAPDTAYLATKVALIMGIMGACRARELHALSIDDIQDLGSAMLVSIARSETEVLRRFTVTDHFYEICKKYVSLRPSNAPSGSFFLNYQKGKCTIQRIGINKFGAMGKQIANYLNLPDPEMYTGHCFRRTSATPLVEVSKRLHIETFQSVVANTSQEWMRKTCKDANLAASVAPVFKTPSEAIRVGIVHSQYPAYTLTEDQLVVLQGSIMKAVEQISDDGPQVRFQDCTQQQGWLLITCADETSSSWLECAINSLQPWEGATLKFVQGQDIPNQHICVAYIPDDSGTRLTSEEVLTRLRKMNHGLNTREWLVLEREESGPGQTWTFLIDEPSMITLASLDNRPYFGFGQIQFHLKIKDENAFPDVFNPSSTECIDDFKPNYVCLMKDEEPQADETGKEKDISNKPSLTERASFNEEC